MVQPFEHVLILVGTVIMSIAYHQVHDLLTFFTN